MTDHFVDDVQRWRVPLDTDCVETDYCEECVSPDGRDWTFDPEDRDVTHPVAMLSTWEHQTLERTLKAF